MTDKEKIYQILSSLWKNDDSVGKMCYNQALQDVQTAIDLQEEPRFKVGQIITDPKDLTFIFHINKIEDGKYIESDDTWVLIKYADEEYQLVEEPKKCMYSKDDYTDEDRKVLCDGCNEKCEYSKKEEPVSEEWIKELRAKLDSLSKEDFEKVFDKYAIDFKEEPVSDVLEEAAKIYARGEYDRKNPSSLPWQCKGCYSPLIYAFKDGAKWQKEQMMINAIDGEIWEVEGNSCGLNSYTRLRAVVDDEELRNMGFKDGDKCKVVILKDTPEYIEGVKGSYTTTTK